MTYAADRRTAHRGHHTESKPRRKRLNARHKRIRRHIAKAIYLVRRTSIGGVHDAVVDEIIRERLRPLFERFRCGNFECVLHLRLCKGRDGFTLCHIILRCIDNPLDCRLRITALAKSIDTSNKRLCRNSEVRHLNAWIHRTAKCRIKPPVIVREKRIAVLVLHLAIFGVACPRLRSAHSLEHTDTHTCTHASFHELSL